MFNHERRLISLVSKIPTLKNERGQKLKIEISMEKIHSVFIYLSLFNEKNQSISIKDLDKKSIEYFINQYRNFLASGKVYKSNSFHQSINLIISTITSVLVNRQATDFGFSLYHQLPFTFINKFYTIDKYDDSVVAQTILRNGQMVNTYNDKIIISVGHFHTTSLHLVYELNMNGSKHYFEIIENLALSLRYSITILAFTMIIRNMMSDYSSVANNLGYSLIFYGFVIAMCISSKIIMKALVYFFINKSFFTQTMDKKISNAFRKIRPFR